MLGFLNKKESGAIVLDGRHVGSTQQCVHCGNHSVVIPGSGKKRGWCRLCNGFLCGAIRCMSSCTPFEAQLDYQEAMNVRQLKLAEKLMRKYPNIKLFI